MSERAAEIAKILKNVSRDITAAVLEEPTAYRADIRVEGILRDLLSSLPPVRGEQPMTRDSHGNNVDFLVSVNAVLNQQGAAFRIDIQNGQAIAVPVPECLSECSGVRGEQETAGRPVAGYFCARCGHTSRVKWLVCDGCGLDIYEEAVSAPVRAEAAKTGTGTSSSYGYCQECGGYHELNSACGGRVSASPVREAEPKLCQAAQYRPGGVFMFNTATRAMENCENELFVKASELDKAEAQWIRIAAEDVRDAKLAGVREAEPLKVLRDYLEDDWPVAVENIRDRCEASVTRFSNDDVSIVVDEYERLRKLCSAALEGAATKGQGND